MRLVPSLLILLVLAGCARADSEVIPTPDADEPSDEFASELTCSPSAVNRRDTIEIVLPEDHGGYLATRSPSGVIFMLAFPSLGDPTAPRPLFSESMFPGLARVELPVSTQLAPWNVEDGLQPIFSEPGTYLITAGENLESDAAYRSWSCTVEFHP